MRLLWLSAAVVLLDQATKAAVVQLMHRHESIPLLGEWLRLTFTENPGMAFGLTIGPTGTVTVLSILATVLVAVYTYRIRHAYAPYRWSLGLILGGALGNIIDRVFYGVLLDYGPLFTGRVVDFIHVSLWRGFIPAGIPFLGGSYLELFPIWNVADMAIVLGVVGVAVFHRPFHEQQYAPEPTESTSEGEPARAQPNGRPADPDRTEAMPDDRSTPPADGSHESHRPHPPTLSLPSPPRRDE
ncbi:MAG: signal peptidase II [Salinibacter sp.]